MGASESRDIEFSERPARRRVIERLKQPILTSILEHMKLFNTSTSR